MTSGLSLAMIVKDEAQTIARVLGDVASICDEIVVIDTGSVDDTAEIARQHGAIVLSFEWTDDFSAARNYSFANCHGDWILWLDADDRVPPESRDALRGIYEEVRGSTEIDTISVPYRYRYSSDGSRCLVSLYRERLIRNRLVPRWSGKIHETIVLVEGRSLSRDDAWVEHRPTPEQMERKTDRNFEALTRMVQSGDRSARTLTYLGHELVKRNSYLEALEIFDEALRVESEPDHEYDTYCAIAECAGKLELFDRQLSTLLDALALDPRRGKAWILTGLFFFSQELWRKALVFFAAATVLQAPKHTLSTTFDWEHSYVAWDYMSVCENQLGFYEASLQHSTAALLGNPEIDRLLANIADSLDHLN